MKLAIVSVYAFVSIHIYLENTSLVVKTSISAPDTARL